MMMRTTAARIEPRAREDRERATHKLIPAASVHALAALFLARAARAIECCSAGVCQSLKIYARELLFMQEDVYFLSRLHFHAGAHSQISL
jgi:hypothetical protein